MAELNTSAGHDRRRGITRSKKLSTRVDLTPMVDLGFLLITFFVFTTNISEPRALDLNMPAGDIPDIKIANSTALTMIPLANDKIFYYHGDLSDAEKDGLYGITNFAIATGIGEVVRQKQKALGAKRADLMLIIRPSMESSFQNLVDALDEVLINDVKHYSVVDITEEEKQYLSAKGIR